MEASSPTIVSSLPAGSSLVILPDATIPYILIAVTLILILGVLCWIIYGLGQGTGVLSSGKVYFECTEGKCATNVYNGEKRCPDDTGQQILYDPAYETCNSRFTCEDPRTPYALLSNGGTSELGVCEPGSICRCLAKPQCPVETMVVFGLTDGSTFLQDNVSSRALFTQTPIGSQGETGAPITYDNTNTQFCAIKAYHLNRLAQGACTFLNPNQVTTTEIRQCLATNPCVIGVAAFHPMDADRFTLTATNTNAIYTTPVACVPGLRTGICGPTSVPVWNQATAEISCYNTGV